MPEENNEQRLEQCRESIYSNSYADYIVAYYGEPSLLEKYNAACEQLVSSKYAVIHIPIIGITDISIEKFGYNAFPNLYGLLDSTNMEEIGINRLRRQPFLDLLGKDVIIGFIDTGIDYQHPVFKNADNTTRIIGIWDQTNEQGTPPDGFYYGQEYTREQINEALAQEAEQNLTEPVLGNLDENGHGTFMAGIAAGNIDESEDFTGAAPLADIAVVRLKEAKLYLREYYQTRQDAVCYQETDILMGIRYLTTLSSSYQKPIVICLGIGTNSGDHEGSSVLSEHLNRIADNYGVAVVTAAGNEVNYRHHYQGNMDMGTAYQDIEIRVGEGERGFSAELWSSAPSSFEVGMISPTGEFIQKIPARYGNAEEVNLLLERTRIWVRYDVIEPRTGNFLIFMRFEAPTPGIWTLRVYDGSGLGGTYHIWLPMRELISENTYFIRPEPNITICEPGNAYQIITVAGYDHTSGSIYINSSRGYTRTDRIKPDITAPAVNIFGPVPGGGFGMKTGTSIASAHAAGAAALLLEWSINYRNEVTLTGVEIKNFMIRGARRDSLSYPNREWGYGILDIFNSFNTLRQTV